MARVAVVAPDDGGLRAALVAIAAGGCVELEMDGGDGAEGAGRNSGGLGRDGSGGPARLLATTPDVAALERAGRADLLAGEAELHRRADAAVRGAGVAAVLGWCPADSVERLRTRLAPIGASVVPLPSPRGVSPPTLLNTSAPLRRSFSGLVEAYGTVPYPDVDPTLLAGLAYVLMFGMMFGDAGHGAVLLLAALALRAGRPRRLARFRPVWPFLAGAGLASAAFGLLFGEFFGPTGAVPVRWLDPLEEPVRLLAAGVGLGAVLLAGAYALGVVNRWREGSARLALYAPSGIAGAALFTGFGALAAGLYFGSAAVTIAGVAIAVPGLALAAIGLFVGSGGGPAGAVETGIHLVDLVIRLGANVVSFARLAAFGLTHAALGALVWTATAALWAAGGWGLLAAVAVFAIGNVVTFGLEAVVAGIQALRLEYYELFSRVFEIEGRPFRPWRVPVVAEEVRT
jgi:V/A-type H+-transporting ATPase subunit I